MVSFNATFTFAASFFTLAFALIFIFSRFWAIKYYPDTGSIPNQSRYLYASGLFLGCAIYLLGQSMLESVQLKGDALILFWHRFQHAGLLPALFFWPLLVADYLKIRVRPVFTIMTGVLGVLLELAVVFTPWFISDKIHVFNFFNKQGVEGPLYGLFQLWAIAVLLLIPVFLIREVIRRVRGRGSDLWLIIFGSVAAVLGAVFDMLGTFGHLELFNNVSLFSIGIVVMCVSFAYDISRHTIRMSGALVRANSLIQQQEKALIEATRFELTGKLVSGVVHDLRNAISIISLANSNLANYGTRLGGHVVEGDIVEVVEHQRQSIEIAGFFLDNIRHFSKGEIMVDFLERFSPLAVIEELKKMLRVRFSEKGIAFNVSIDQDCILSGSKGHFLQTALNLILNAIDAVDRGGLISVRMESFATESARILFEDNGPGIPEEKKEQVFDFLFTTKERGTGIGLYITRKVTEKNRGSVRILDSCPGCVFEVQWPTWNPQA